MCLKHRAGTVMEIASGGHLVFRKLNRVSEFPEKLVVY